MELAVSIEIRHPSKMPGAIALPSEKLKGICAALPGEDVELKLKATSQCSIKSGGASFRVNTLPAGDFPTRGPLSADGDVKRFEIPAVELRRLLSRTAFAMSDEETRYYLNGVHLVHKHDVLVVEATNGHVLARAEADLPDGAMDIDILIPAKTVGVVLPALKGREDAVSIEASEHRIIFGIGDARIDSRLIEGTFPNTDRVIPRGNHRILTANADAFLAAVSAAAVVGEVKKDF